MQETVKLDRTEVNPKTNQMDSTGDYSSEIPGLQLIAKKDETSAAFIWQALQLSLDREVVVWMMKKELTHNSVLVEHFEVVARAVSRVRHPNLVQVIDVARAPDGTPYIVFEDVEGTMLSVLLRMERKFDPNRAFRIGIEISKALDFAWKQCGFIHRNIKPETIHIGTGDSVKLTNFSSATLVQPGKNPLAYDEGLVVGTPNYVSPEQIECLRTIDFHSDMYSTGALLYRMITGLTPFGTEDDPMAVFELQRNGTLENPRDLDPSVKPGVVHVIQKMMAKAPEDRYMWWQDVIEDMHRVLEGRPPYMESGNYVPPISTVAPSLAELPSGARSVRSSKVRKKGPSGDAIGSPRSLKASGVSKGGASGPSAWVKLVFFILLIVFCIWLVRFRVSQLEDRQSDVVATPVVILSEEPVAGVESSVAPLHELSADVKPVGTDVKPFDSNLGEDTEIDAWTVQPSATEDPAASIVAKQDTGADAVQALTTQGALVKTLYRNVVDYSLLEARERARTLFKESQHVADLDEEECKKIWRAFSEASSYEELVGVSLASSPVERPLKVGGEQIVFFPRMYSNGELIGDLKLEDGTVKSGHRIRLSAMSAEEIYDCIQVLAVDTNRSALFSRAFLTMKMKDRGAFSLFVAKYAIKELEPFLDYVGK